MDIIEQAEQIAIEQQKQGLTKELFDMYEKFLNLSWEFIFLQQMVINGTIDRNLLDDDDERLEAIRDVEKAIETARACIDAE